MLVTIVVIIIAVVFCRYLLPMVILSIAGAISKNDEMTQQNKQNITATRSNGYQFSALHIIERLMIYADMICVGICLFFPKICFPFVIALLVLIVIQIFECVFALKTGTAYTWIYASMFGRRGNNAGGMYSASINGNMRRPGLFGRNNQYNNGYNQSYGGINQGYGYNNQSYGYNNNGYGYNSNQNYSAGSIGNRNIRNQNLNTRGNNLFGNQAIDSVNGKRQPDGNIQGWPVWSVNGSKKCYITDKGRMIYRDTHMTSFDGKNVSDDSSMLIFEFVGDTQVETVCKVLSKVKSTTIINAKGVCSKRLYVTDSGEICETPFSDTKYPKCGEIENGIVFKNPDTDYYVAERCTKSGMVISTLSKTENGYSFVSVNNGITEKYEVSEDFNLISINGNKVESIKEESSDVEEDEDTVSIIGGIKEVFESLPSRSALKVKVQNLANVKLAGFGNDGVYNDGTVDVMCEFGELMIIEEKAYLPTLQSLVLSKLIPALDIDDIMRRIGDGWSDSTLGKMLDDACSTIKQQVEAKESQCINYWITDDKDVYYLSFVFNGDENLDDSAINSTYSIAKKAFLKLNITVDKEVGYRCSTYNADKTKFSKTDDNKQTYFNINPINTTPDLFGEYLIKVDNAAEMFKTAAKFTGLTFKVRVLNCMSFKNNGKDGYCCKTYLSKSFLFDWERNKSIVKNKLRSSITTPAKMRDLLNNSVKSNFYEKFSPVFAIAYGTDGDTMEVNFLFGTGEYNKDELYDSIFNTPLITYSCYDRLDNYLLDSSRDKDVYVILFKNKENKNVDKA